MNTSIRTRESFERLRREGRRVRSGALWCAYVIDPQLDAPAIAFAFGRATGNAVARNRLRRRCREILRSTADLPPGLYLIGGGRTASELTFACLRRQLDVLVDRIPS